MQSARQLLALSLAGFQFTHRHSNFDWRLLYGIDVDTVIRLTDVAAVDDCLPTLQRGCFAAESSRLSLANCVQLFRLLQLAIEYCDHLRGAHAGLLGAYEAARDAAEGLKAAARAYLDAASAYSYQLLAASGAGPAAATFGAAAGGAATGGLSGSLSRAALEAADGAEAALEAAYRKYNAALDALETEDSRVRHFRFRRQSSELSWSSLHAADPDRLVAEWPAGLDALEGLLPNLMHGSITNEDEQQLTRHHFAQLIPLAQAALDYVLWQVNTTGALLEQAMATLGAACEDIPLLTTATQEVHANIASLELEAQQAGVSWLGALPLGGAGGGTMAAGGGPAMLGFGTTMGGGGMGTPLRNATGGMGFGGGGVGSSLELVGGGRPLLRALSPASVHPSSSGAAGLGAGVQALRMAGGSPALGPSRFAGVGGGVGGSVGMAASGAFGSLDDLLAAAAGPGGSPGGGFPAAEFHSRAAQLSYKVDAIEHDLRLERSKTEEMRLILADVRERLNQQRPPSAPFATTAAGATESVTFPAAAASSPPLSSAYNPASVAAGPGGAGRISSSGGGAAGGGGRYGSSAAGVSLSPSQAPYAEHPHSPAKVRVYVDEDAIREQERQRAVEVLARQAERLKLQMLREHAERRLDTSAATAAAALQLQQLGSSSTAAGAAIGTGAAGHAMSGSGAAGGNGVGARRSRDASQSSSRAGGGPRRGARHRPTASADYTSDPEFAHGGGGFGMVGGDPRAMGGQGYPGGGNIRPPKPVGLRSNPAPVDAMVAAAAAGVYGMGGGGGGGGAAARSVLASGASTTSAVAAGGGGGRGRPASSGGGRYGPLSESVEDPMVLPPSNMYARKPADYTNTAAAAAAAVAAAPSRGFPAAAPTTRAMVPFGSISLVGSAAESEVMAAVAATAAAGNTGSPGALSRGATSSFSDRLTHVSQLPHGSAPMELQRARTYGLGGGGGGEGGGGGFYGYGGGGGSAGAGGGVVLGPAGRADSGGGGWDAAGVVAASLPGR